MLIVEVIPLPVLVPINGTLRTTPTKFKIMVGRHSYGAGVAFIVDSIQILFLLLNPLDISFSL
jgi:hypothetical protein